MKLIKLDSKIDDETSRMATEQNYPKIIRAIIKRAQETYSETISDKQIAISFQYVIDNFSRFDNNPILKYLLYLATARNIIFSNEGNQLSALSYLKQMGKTVQIKPHKSQP